MLTIKPFKVQYHSIGTTLSISSVFVSATGNISALIDAIIAYTSTDQANITNCFDILEKKEKNAKKGENLHNMI